MSGVYEWSLRPLHSTLQNIAIKEIFKEKPYVSDKIVIFKDVTTVTVYPITKISF